MRRDVLYLQHRDTLAVSVTSQLQATDTHVIQNVSELQYVYLRLFLTHNLSIIPEVIILNYIFPQEAVIDYITYLNECSFTPIQLFFPFT